MANRSETRTKEANNPISSHQADLVSFAQGTNGRDLVAKDEGSKSIWKKNLWYQKLYIAWIETVSYSCSTATYSRYK